jgi:hypothetical protein
MDGDWAGKIVGVVIAIVIAVSLVPTIYSVINATNTTAWSSLTGGSGAQAIFQLILLCFVAGIVIAVIKYMLQ